MSRIKNSLLSKLLIKVFIILAVGFIYTVVAATSENKNNYIAPGICVFDIDFTLGCKGAHAAVQVCKDYGFELAVNTARDKRDAYKVVNNGTLANKGFPQEFIDKAKKQNGLKGPFQYRESWKFSQPEEQKYHNKSFGMRQIAEHYSIKVDDIASRTVVLFDDMLHNIVQMQPNKLESYNNERCKFNNKGKCYENPNNSPKSVSYPRNWKIYRSKWIGYLCARWDDPKKAAEDAMEVVYDVLMDNKRKVLNKSIVKMRNQNIYLNTD